MMAKAIDSGFVPILYKNMMLNEALDCTTLGEDGCRRVWSSGDIVLLSIW